MAFGINDAMPLAMFLHAKEPTDIKPVDTEGKRTVILVDSVVNNGDTVVKFVKHIRTLDPNIRIVVVAGVVQKESMSESGKIMVALKGLGPVSVVALRLSDNKFTGKGTTDTGNRLFNTTQLP